MGSPIDRIDGFALDLDGVVWLAGEPIPGAPEAVGRLRERAPVVFLTNDPRSTREQYLEHLRAVGVEAELDEMLTSSAAAAEIVARKAPGARVYVVGSDALGRELAAAGLEVTGRGGPGVDFVVVGGHSGFDYAELAGGMAAVRAGAELWATNRDPVYPTATGLLPGTGAVVAAVETASGRAARVAGKPERPMFEAARRRLGAERPVIVGDSLDSDIAGGAGAGFATVLVLSGRASAADADAAPVRPDVVADDLPAFVAGLD
ncbi:MAG TPA: HAD-IIA family hydrolase [Solirubrobacterales bacterium]|nr:HAD-IIA family hydrolase [Solirubrobacterales bacterium]